MRPADKLKGDELKPFAFVTFEREEIARKLVKLGGDVMCGIRINIKPVITKDPSAAPYGPARPQVWLLLLLFLLLILLLLSPEVEEVS